MGEAPTTGPLTGPYLSPAAPRVLAHRGLATFAPENTMLSFVAALAHGVTHLETDVHASRDRVAVISHDPELTRLTGRTGRVGDLTMAELAAIDLGDGQSFVSLAEAIDAFPEARFNIDIKSDAAVQPTVDAVRATRSSGRVLITSFSGARRRVAVKLLPSVATSASSRQFALAFSAALVGAAPLARWMLRDVHAVQIPETVRGIRLVTPRIIRIMHSAVQEVHVWTVNDVADMHRLLDLGIDGLVTDRADLAMQVLLERSRR